MAVETNPRLPEANRVGGIDQAWAGDDQQWWDWYVTLAENDPALTPLVPGPPRPDVVPADDTDVAAVLEEPYALEAADVLSFQQFGFVTLRQVLPAAVVVRLADRLQELLVQAHGTDTAGRFLALEQMWLHDPLMRAVALSPRLGGLAATLLDAPRVRLYHDNALSKEPGCGRTPWHHDAEHFPFSPPEAVTAWMPLSAVPDAMGPLSFACDRSVQELVADVAFDKVGTSYDAAVTARLRQARVRVHSQPYAVGEISFHSAQCFHTAGPNRTSLPRRALATTYLADGVRVVDAPSMISGTWQEFVPATSPGGLVQSPLNPVVGSRMPT